MECKKLSATSPTCDFKESHEGNKENLILKHERLMPKQLEGMSFNRIIKIEPNEKIPVSNGNNESTNIKVEDSYCPVMEGDSSAVDSGIDENLRDGSVVTSAMLEEERKLQIALQKEEEKQRKEYEKKEREREKEEQAKVIKEMRYKRLMNLLKKSQFYASFLTDKVSTVLADDKRKESKSSGKRKKPDIKEFSEEIISACKKMKTVEGAALTQRYTEEEDDETTQLQNGSLNSDQTGSKTSEPVKKDNTIVTSLGITVSERQPKLLEGACLRDYQLDGLNWLRILFESGMNGILADEMGLGKTVQVISFICHLYESSLIGPFLIVGPLSTLPNWILEFSRFAPQLKVILYHGTEMDRKKMRKDVTKKYLLQNQKVYPVILTSYEIPVRDSSFLSKIQWKYIIVDEGHRLKNYKSLLSRTLSSFNSVNRLLLTGTPLQNDLTELWSLLHFLLPDIFDSLDVFQSWFEVEDIERGNVAEVLVEREKKNKILTILHKILAPFLLRRVKTEVCLNLPPKKEVLVYCPMSKIQRKLYEAILDKSIIIMMKGPEESLIIQDNPDGSKVKRKSALRKDNNGSFNETPKETDSDTIVVDSGIDQYILKPKLTNPSMCLRKTVNHPYLINMPVLPGSSILRVDEGIVSDSGKVTILDGLLSRLKERNHKVILFSTFTTLLDLLEEFVIMREYDYERLDGNVDLESRKKSIYRFNTDENAFIFLISTRAGGLGINLTAADTAIIFDSDWNPQADLQAQDRCHRIGQTRPVVVYRFITEGTLDEKIYSRGTAKRKLEKIIIHKGNFNNTRKSKPDNIDLEELKELLNSKSCCGELRTDGSALTEKEWDKLLDRSDLLEEMKAKENS